MTKVHAAIAALAMIALIAAGASACAPAKTETEPVPAPEFSLKDLQGNALSLASYKGKVLILNFWATWCPPCVGEMPSIQRLYEKLKDEEVVFVCVSQEDSTKVSRFIKEKGFTFPIYTMKGAPPAVFNTRGIPATFILSSGGKVAFRHVGGARWDDEKAVDFIRRQQP